MRSRWKAQKLSAEEVEALDSVDGWVWNAKSVQITEMHQASQATFLQRAALLREFVAEQGRIPRDKEVFRGVPLGSWCSMQRFHYKRGQLADDAVAAMESIDGWVWNLRDKRNEVLKAATQETFQTRLPLLAEFARAHGRGPKQCEEYLGVKLGWWADSQRKRYRRGTLAPEEVEALEAIPFWTWDPLGALREHRRTERERRDQEIAEKEAMAIETLQFLVGSPSDGEEEAEEARRPGGASPVLVPVRTDAGLQLEAPFIVTPEAPTAEPESEPAAKRRRIAHRYTWPEQEA